MEIFVNGDKVSFNGANWFNPLSYLNLLGYGVVSLGGRNYKVTGWGNEAPFTAKTQWGAYVVAIKTLKTLSLI